MIDNMLLEEAKKNNNALIRGVHHISESCYKKDYNKVIHFYCDVLGLKILRVWGEDKIPDGIMIGLGNAVLEVFTNKEKEEERGIIRHYALDVKDVESLVNKIKDAGYDVFMEPTEISISASPVVKAKIAFCHGPLGEEIELFEEHK